MVRSARLSVPRLVFLLALVACEAPADVRKSSFVVTDSAGVAIVTGPAEDIPLAWTLTEAFRVGGADTGAGSFSLAYARAAATDAAGNIYVLDSKQHRVEVFDATGAHVRFLGRKGGGPGEFQDAYDLLVTPNGEASVVDYAKRALVRWSPVGDVLPEFPLTDFFPNDPLWLSGDTLVYVHAEYNEGKRSKALRVRTATDTFTTPALMAATSGMIMFGCIGLNLPPMFTPEFTWAGDAYRQAVTHQVPYRIDIYQGGVFARSVRRALPPVTADASHVARLHPEGGMKIGFASGECTVPVNELIEKQGMASQLPMIESLRFDPAGRLWAQRFGFREEPRSVDVFAPDGDYLGTLAGRSLPLGFIGDDLVLFGEVDADTDLPYIVAYRVGRGAGNQGVAANN